jgi:hypothetical protein
MPDEEAQRAEDMKTVPKRMGSRARRSRTGRGAIRGVSFAAVMCIVAATLCAAPVQFVCDEPEAQVTAHCATDDSMIETGRTVNNLGNGKWACTLYLAGGSQYRVTVEKGGSRATGPTSVLVVSDQRLSMEYIFRHSTMPIGGIQLPRAQRPEQPVDPPPGRSDGWVRKAAIGVIILSVAGIFSMLMLSATTKGCQRTPLARPPPVPTWPRLPVARPEGWPEAISRENPHILPLRRLATGGLASVFLVRDTHHGDMPVALKTLHEQFCMVEEEDLKSRFLDEPAILRHLGSTGFVPSVVDASQPTVVRPWFEMEYLEAMESLRHRFRRGGGRRMTYDQALPVMREILRGVLSLHAHDVLHRDLSPENVMVTMTSPLAIRIIDFGGAKFGRRAFSREQYYHNMTRPGQQIGKVRYTAPEVWRHGIQQADAMSDGYSLAVIFWEMLTGLPPFNGTRIDEVRQKQIHSSVSASMLLEANVPLRLARTLCALLSADQKKRPSLEELAQDEGIWR